MKKRNIITFFAVFLGTILLNIFARNSVTFADWYLDNVLPLWINMLGRISGIFPFSLGEMMMVAGAILVFLGIVFAILALGVVLFVRKKRN